MRNYDLVNNNDAILMKLEWLEKEKEKRGLPFSFYGCFW